MTKEKGEIKKEVKYVADIIGEWGRWQLVLSSFMFIVEIVTAISNMGYSFHAFDVDYWCHDVPHNLENKTEEMRCFKYTNSSEKCTKWRYDKSVFDETLRSEFDLVCDRKYLASLSQSLYMAGYILAGTIIAYLSDKYGRRPTAIISFLIEIGASISCAMSTSIIQYLISRLLVGMATTGRNITFGSLFLECLGPKHRADIVLIVGLGWVFGYCVLPALAIWLRSFRYMQFFGSSILVVMFVLFLFLYESPRWQIANGYYDQAENTIRNALKMNGKSDENLKENMIQLRKHIEQEAKQEANQKKASIVDLVRRPNLRKYTLIFCLCFTINALIYYAISYEIGSFGGNYYVSFILGGLIEAPGQILCLITFKYTGRKRVGFIFYAVACFASLLLIPNNPTLRVTAALITKLCINSAWYAIGILMVETYPTVLRSTGRGLSSAVSRIGAIIGPFMKHISANTGLTPVFISYSIMGAVCAYFVILLPETKGREIPDTVDEAENAKSRNSKIKQESK